MINNGINAKVSNNKKIIIFFLLLVLSILTACSNDNATTNDKNNQKNQTIEQVEINDNSGTIKIPKDPKSVVVLDSRSFQTISDWNINVTALPKDLIPENIEIKNNENVLNIGNHREPNFENIAASNPDLVIVGQRFSSHLEEIKKIVPNAKVVDININLDVDDPADALIKGLTRNTEILGKIFNREKEAKELINELNNSIEEIKMLNLDDKTFMGLIVSAGNIGYSAPSKGRVWGPIFDMLELKSPLDINNESSNHKGDDISLESIAQSNPDILLVLDRDAAITTTDSKPAKDVIEGSKVLKNTKAVKNNNIFYAPNDTYTNESIQTYIELFNSLYDFLDK